MILRHPELPLIAAQRPFCEPGAACAVPASRAKARRSSSPCIALRRPDTSIIPPGYPDRLPEKMRPSSAVLAVLLRQPRHALGIGQDAAQQAHFLLAGLAAQEQAAQLAH